MSPLLIAVGVIGLGLFFVVEAQEISVPAAYDRIGPRFFPFVGGVALVLLGAALAWQALRGGWQRSEEEMAPAAWPGLALVTAGLLAQMSLMEEVGYVLSSALLFVLVALAFGSRRYLRDAVVGLALSAVSYVGFTRGLDLALPAGWLEGLI